jgi:hypothetical protein
MPKKLQPNDGGMRMAQVSKAECKYDDDSNNSKEGGSVHCSSKNTRSSSCSVEELLH